MDNRIQRLNRLQVVKLQNRLDRQFHRLDQNLESQQLGIERHVRRLVGIDMEHI
jgi:hypothetical protein